MRSGRKQTPRFGPLINMAFYKSCPESKLVMSISCRGTRVVVNKLCVVIIFGKDLSEACQKRISATLTHASSWYSLLLLC